MPNGPRVVLEGVCYHIISRGNQQQVIFKNEVDFKVYLARLRKYKKRYGFKIYSYCLMPNHVHIVGEIAKATNLCKFMQGINRSYTAYFNKKYNMTGHLWQGRFKSKIIVKDAYLVECITYVELNPVRANMVNSPYEYRWNSYKERVLDEKKVMLDNLSI